MNLPGKWEVGEIYALAGIFSEYLRPELEKNFDIAVTVLAFKPNFRHFARRGFVAYLKGQGRGKIELYKNLALFYFSLCIQTKTSWRQNWRHEVCLCKNTQTLYINKFNMGQ